MKNSRVKNQVFHRIGDTYGHLIDGDHFMGRNAFDELWLTRPSTNVIKKPDECYRLEVALPGFNKEEIGLSISNNLLKVKAEKKEESELPGKYIRKETDVEFMERAFELTSNIDQDHIKASYKNGILSVFLPYRQNGTTAKKTITIA
ncbi:MAG: Hsp20/alpha crystallin family protein [Bacteroidota bacterium]